MVFVFKIKSDRGVNYEKEKFSIPNPKKFHSSSLSKYLEKKNFETITSIYFFIIE